MSNPRWWRKQLNLFWLALSFFSRLPLPGSLIYSAKHLSHSSRFFALVGWVLALLLSVSFTVFDSVFPSVISVALTLIMSVLLTGAFHEDGLADTADGLWGGYTTHRKLEIMKDSRIGTYGASALVLSVLLRYVCWLVLAQQGVFILALILAYPLSRAFAASLIYSMAYVTENDTSKSKPLATSMTGAELAFLLGSGGVGLLWWDWHLITGLLLSLWLLRMWFISWLNKHIGGITGDCLGAAQQVSELVIYLAVIALSIDQTGMVL